MKTASPGRRSSKIRTQKGKQLERGLLPGLNKQ